MTLDKVKRLTPFFEEIEKTVQATRYEYLRRILCLYAR